MRAATGVNVGHASKRVIRKRSSRETSTWRYPFAFRPSTYRLVAMPRSNATDVPGGASSASSAPESVRSCLTLLRTIETGLEACCRILAPQQPTHLSKFGKQWVADMRGTGYFPASGLSRRGLHTWNRVSLAGAPGGRPWATHGRNENSFHASWGCRSGVCRLVAGRGRLVAAT